MRVAAGLAAHTAACGEMAGKIVARLRDYRACFDVYEVRQALITWTTHARALVDDVAPLPQGAAEGVLQHTERAQLRSLLALLGNAAAGGGRLPPEPTTLVVFGVEQMSERILQRRLSSIVALDRSRARARSGVRSSTHSERRRGSARTSAQYWRRVARGTRLRGDRAHRRHHRGAARRSDADGRRAGRLARYRRERRDRVKCRGGALGAPRRTGARPALVREGALAHRHRSGRVPPSCETNAAVAQGSRARGADRTRASGVTCHDVWRVVGRGSGRSAAGDGGSWRGARRHWRMRDFRQRRWGSRWKRRRDRRECAPTADGA